MPPIDFITWHLNSINIPRLHPCTRVHRVQASGQAGKQTSASVLNTSQIDVPQLLFKALPCMAGNSNMHRAPPLDFTTSAAPKLVPTGPEASKGIAKPRACAVHQNIQLETEYKSPAMQAAKHTGRVRIAQDHDAHRCDNDCKCDDEWKRVTVCALPAHSAAGHGTHLLQYHETVSSTPLVMTSPQTTPHLRISLNS